MSIANLLSMAKHGFSDYLAGSPLAVTIFLSYSAAGLGILHLEAGTIRAHMRQGGLRQWIHRGALGKFALFVVAIATVDSVLFVFLDAALGLVPVLAFEGLSGFRRRRSMVGGVVFSLLAMLAYLLHLSVDSWFDHRDLAHVLMMLGYWILYRGVRISSRRY